LGYFWHVQINSPVYVNIRQRGENSPNLVTLKKALYIYDKATSDVDTKYLYLKKVLNGTPRLKIKTTTKESR
jgi:hypothetical protein